MERRRFIGKDNRQRERLGRPCELGATCEAIRQHPAYDEVRALVEA